MPEKTALIVGAGEGISAAFARALARDGYRIALAARRTDKLEALARETGAETIACDVERLEDIRAMFARADELFGTLGVLLYNPSYRVRGPITELDPAEVDRTLRVTAWGAFVAAQEAARRMLAAREGAILLTGASAGVKGYPGSAPFAMGKFALRGLAQSLARELHPKNVHVAHFVIDGAVRLPGRDPPADRPDSMLEPDAIAQTYMAVLNQHRSAWSWEVEIRPWVETF